jgi:general secretion pathway protein J
VNRQRSSGFTLLEILVALLVFSIVGLISSQLMSQTIRSNEVLKEHGDRLAQIHRAMQILQRDVMQMAQRPIRGNYGDDAPALMIGADGAIEFSRNGWRNPLNLPRAEVQRVGFVVRDEKLMRGYWPVLDRAQDTEPVSQTLLSDVEQAEFFALDSAGNEHTFWPQSGLPPDIRLIGLVLRIEIEPFGVVERIWDLPDGQ